VGGVVVRRARKTDGEKSAGGRSALGRRAFELGPHPRCIFPEHASPRSNFWQAAQGRATHCQCGARRAQSANHIPGPPGRRDRAGGPNSLAKVDPRPPGPRAPHCSMTSRSLSARLCWLVEAKSRRMLHRLPSVPGAESQARPGPWTQEK